VHKRKIPSVTYISTYSILCSSHPEKYDEVYYHIYICIITPLYRLHKQNYWNGPPHKIQTQTHISSGPRHLPPSHIHKCTIKEAHKLPYLNPQTNPSLPVTTFQTLYLNSYSNTQNYINDTITKNAWAICHKRPYYQM
jgi:hypothetical protein